MPFVQGKCESCGGILTVDPSLKAANCPFCGAAYVVQDSINYYNTSIKVENMHADVVNITDESSSEARLKAGAAYLRIGKYDLAEKEYLYVTKMAPQNYLGWLGLIEARTNNYTKLIKSAKGLKLLDDYSRSVSTFAPNGSGNNLIEKWENYQKSEEERNATEKEKLSIELSEYERKLNELLGESNSSTLEISKKEKQLYSLIRFVNGKETVKAPTSVGFWIVGIFWTWLVFTLLMSNKGSFDSSAIPVFVAMFLVGAFILVVAFLIAKKRRKYANESKQLKDELNSLNIRKAEIKKQITDIQSVVKTIQRQIDEYD